VEVGDGEEPQSVGFPCVEVEHFQMVSPEVHLSSIDIKNSSQCNGQVSWPVV